MALARGNSDVSVTVNISNGIDGGSRSGHSAQLRSVGCLARACGVLYSAGVWFVGYDVVKWRNNRDSPTPILALLESPLITVYWPSEGKSVELSK
jgi:hypothetical protein